MKIMSEDNGILSQDEIDALMNQDGGDNGNQDKLTHEEKDVLGEIGNIAMGSAATALYTLLNQKVEITTPQVQVSSFKEITAEYNRPCVLVKVEYVAGIEGINLLIIREEDAAIIADLMMGGDGTNKSKELDEIHISAVGEAMNQMMGSASTSLSSIINDVVNISPPEAKYLDLDEVIGNDDEYFASDELLVSTSFHLKVGNLIDSSFKQLAPLQFTKQLVSKLMAGESGGLTAKNDNVRQEEVSATAEKEILSRLDQEITENEEPPVRRAPAVAQSSNVSSNGEAVGVKRAQFPDFNGGTPSPLPQNMELIQDVPLQVTVRLGKARMTIKEILDLGEGSIVELDKLAGEPVDLLVNGKLVAKGEVVVIDESFGFRVKDIISPMDRINNI